MIKKLFSKQVLLVGIIVLASALRLYKLDTLPALNADEAALGYNAYSLLKTGLDEHGNAWPIHFQSFNDWKPGLTVYLIMPTVAAFGMNEWSVRIIPALLSIATVFVLYLLVKELFGNTKFALLSALFLAISPWHIHFSRGAWEVNVAAFFMTTGVLLFVKGLKNHKLFIFSGLSFVLSLYAYHASRVVVPLLCIGLACFYANELKKLIKPLGIALVISLIVVLPLAFDFLKPESFSRAAGVGLFADPGPRSRIEEQRGQHGDYSALFPKFVHNKAVNYGLAFLNNWLAHYHGEFLFLSGEVIQRNRVPETGEMYTVDAIFIIVALASLIASFSKMGKDRRGWLFIILWAIVGPVAAALTFQAPHALRAANMAIPLVTISAFGALRLLEVFKSKRYRNLVSSVFIIVLFLGVSRYLLMYYGHMIYEYPYSSQYGVKELAQFIKPISQNYDKILITDRYDQPYILFLFYMQYPPEKFQVEGHLTDRDGFGFSTVRSFSNFEFRSIKYDQDRPVYKNSLIAGTDKEIPKETNIIKDIYGTNNFLYFRVVEN